VEVESMVELLRSLLVPAFALAVAIYGPLTLLTWERGPYRIIERIRNLTPEGSELDLLVNCGICMTPSVVAVVVGGWWFVAGREVIGVADAGILFLMAWGWLWVLIRMTRFGRA